MKDSDPRVVGKLFFQMVGEGRVEFEEDELGFCVHPFDDLSCMAAFSGTELDHHARAGEV